MWKELNTYLDQYFNNNVVGLLKNAQSARFFMATEAISVVILGVA
ncbi:hypothetical protein N646_0506 [Vibrio alginolyticus NBRC 15630 = ATCC 17749]|uniref:Uncharacterized protein n=1 Tax=Vibrio alginolyticus (strain ATCC 17749 / DSM 2171 / NBRC 15630 / NCIMB 1903 / NCTC 12160 / XII-53) TaxID=1219076 RepID=A0A2I3C1P7_VIBAX|nr:hypothetical protein N646_0506 [Vibrio alginolyticus NBRC 15630 = ATCC 17749]